MPKVRINKSLANADNAAENTKSILSSLESKSDTDKVVIVSEKRKGKKVIGVEKEPVAFDSDGKATVTVKEAKYFLTVPGFSVDDSAVTETEPEETEEKTKEGE
jgi:hypothetical protein